MKPVLLTVAHDWAGCVGPILTKLAGNTFERVVNGNVISAFEAEKVTEDPLVVLIGGTGSHEVLRETLDWKNKDGSKRVKWVHSYWTGIDAFGLGALAELLDGVPVTNARSTFAPMLAEHVLLSALYFNRQVPRLQANRKDRLYDRFPLIPGAEQTMGIIGYGDIGRHVAKAAMGGLGMKVKGLKTSVPQSSIDDLGVELFSGSEGLDNILATCDVVVAVLPKTPATLHMLRREHFRKMKPSAIFVNIGRGASIVEDDLIDSILAGEIKGAALDVFEVEPIPLTSRLWELDDTKLLLTPHNADISAHSYSDAVDEFVAHATAYSTSNSLPSYRVDVRRGY